MIGAISNIQVTSFPNIISIKSANSKLPVPVRPLYSISAVFKHISPVPSSTGQAGIPLYKLRVLDNLLDRFMQKNVKRIKITADNIDSLISKALNKLKSQSYIGEQYSVSFRAEKGLIINLVA